MDGIASHAPHRQQCLSPRQRWRSSTSSTSTLIFPSHHPLHVSHITAMPEKNVCRYLNKVDSRWRACVTITRYTCILDVTLDPPNAWIIIQTMRSTFISLVIQPRRRAMILPSPERFTESASKIHCCPAGRTSLGLLTLLASQPRGPALLHVR